MKLINTVFSSALRLLSTFALFQVSPSLVNCGLAAKHTLCRMEIDTRNNSVVRSANLHWIQRN